MNVLLVATIVLGLLGTVKSDTEDVMCGCSEAIRDAVIEAVNDVISANLSDTISAIVSAVNSTVDAATRTELSNFTATVTEKVDIAVDTSAVSINTSCYAPRTYSSCAEMKHDLEDTVSGVYTIYPGSGSTATTAYCDMTTEGGGWTIFQRRDSTDKISFHKTYADFQNGFGNRSTSHWMGLTHMKNILDSEPHELRVHITHYNGTDMYAKYGTFGLGSAYSGYKLNVGSYSGDAGDTLTAYHDFEFVADGYDPNNRRYHCGEHTDGAHWATHSFRPGTAQCQSLVALNGVHSDSDIEDQNAASWPASTGGRSVAVKEASMMFRPKQIL